MKENEEEMGRKNISEKGILDFTEGVIMQLVDCHGEMETGFSHRIKCEFHHVYKQYRELCFRTDPQTLLGQVQIIYENNLIFIFLFAQCKKGIHQDRLKIDYNALKRALTRVNSAFAKRRMWVVYPLGNDECRNWKCERIERILQTTLIACEYELFREPEKSWGRGAVIEGV